MSTRERSKIMPEPLSKYMCLECGSTFSFTALKLFGDKILAACPKCGAPLAMKLRPKERKILIAV